MGVAPATVVPSKEERHQPIWSFQCLGCSGDSCRCHPYFPVVQLIGLQYSVLVSRVEAKYAGWAKFAGYSQEN